jgi:hypothetical protein
VRIVNCPRCNAPLDLSKPACTSCGLPVDEVFGKMIEDKARALLAAEKQREKDDAAEASRLAAQRGVEEQRAKDERLLQSLYAMQETSARTPRRVWHLSKAWFVFFAIVAAIIGGVCFPACIEPWSGHSMVAGRLFCPSVCPTCHGPGRVFSWHETTGSGDTDVATQVCHNGTIDIDALTWSDVTSRQDGDLKPYRLTLWTSAPVDFAILFVLLILFGPFFAARMHNKTLERQRRLAEEGIDRLSAKLNIAPRAPPDAPYR